MSLLLAAGLSTLVGAPAHAAAPECTNAELVASYRSTGSGMSHEFGRIVLRNVSDTACSIRGYGGLSYVGGGDGTQVGAAATRTSGPVRSILVRPGKRVVSEVSASDFSPYPRHRCRPAHVDGFRVYLPDEDRAQFVAHPTTGCRNDRVHLLAHRAFARP
ncbi:MULTISPECIES: DUF4232 domain-containing protein [unclassified Nocardioides]|uniref:DUF4232 domain-containing protein n=1 Tax=unclassified Nocardioides TaxID=2615069 RepID=UPI00138EE11D|nr:MULTISPECIES: DUF4232 domain-containing protein [unclassified Nocardioides]